MRVIFCGVLLFFSAFVNAKALDCSKLSIKNFKFSKNCMEGTFVELQNKSKINPECVVSAKLGAREQSLYFNQTVMPKTNYIGLNKECEGHEGHTTKDLPKGCKIFFNFNALSRLDYNSCVCSSMGCAQHMISNLNEAEIKDLKATIGTQQEDRHNVTKLCNGDIEVIDSPEDKTAIMLNSTECIFRADNGVSTDYGTEIFCSDESRPTEEELKRLREHYRPMSLRISSTGRIYAVVCVPIKKQEPAGEKPLTAAERKNLPFGSYWPANKYDKPGVIQDATNRKTDK